MALEIDDINLSGVFSATTISATTIVFGGQPIQNVFVQNVVGGYLPISGGTVTGETIFNSGLSANTLSGGTLYSGSTNLYDIFSTSSGPSGVSTHVQPGSNITTGGTATNPIISVVDSPSFNSVTASGASSFTTLSATTFISGSTNLYSIFQTIGSADQDPYLNLSGGTVTGNTVFTQGLTASTFSANTINVNGQLTGNDGATFLRLSGNSIFVGGSTGGTVQGNLELVLQQTGDTFGPTILRLRNRNGENGAIFETTDTGITLVDFIFKTSSNQRNIRYESRPASAFLAAPEFQFGVPANPSLVVGDNSVLVRGSNGIRTTSLSATTLSGGTIFSGNTNLQNYFTLISQQIATKVNESGDTFTGQVNAPSLSATTLSGGTLFSGSTNLSTIINNAVGNMTVYSGTAKHFYGYYSGANISITAGWTDVNISTSLIEDASYYTHINNSAEVTVTESGTYDIYGRVSIANNSNNNSSTAEARISIDTGGGYVPLLGSNGFVYLLGATAANTRNGTIALVGKAVLPANSKIKLQSQRSNGSGTMVAISGGTNLNITRY